MENTITSNIDREGFRIFLQKEFEARKQKNSAYSLRSFAKQLDIHASCLSVILRGKRPLTTKLINRFTEKLCLSEKELNLISSPGNYEYKDLSIDVFALISDWKHDAVLELLKWETVIHDEKWIAKTLELSITEIQIILDRLERLNLIKIENEKYLLVNENTEFQIESLTTSGLKQYQKNALNKSEQALEEVDVSKRYHGTMVMSIDESLIAEAKQALRDFRLKFCQDFQKRKNFNQIYQLNLGFYPISKNGEQNENTNH